MFVWKLTSCYKKRNSFLCITHLLVKLDLNTDSWWTQIIYVFIFVYLSRPVLKKVHYILRAKINYIKLRQQNEFIKWKLQEFFSFNFVYFLSYRDKNSFVCATKYWDDNSFTYSPLKPIKQIHLEIRRSGPKMLILISLNESTFSKHLNICLFVAFLNFPIVYSSNLSIYFHHHREKQTLNK